MYKRTPTTPTGDYARWLADENTDLTGPPSSSSKPKFATADPSPEPTLKIPTDTKADGSVLEQVVEVMKEKQLLEATLARMEASMEAKLAQFEAMAAAKDEANELLQRKIDGLIAENDTIKKQIELQPEPQPSIPSMLQKTRAGLKAVRQQLNAPPEVQTEGLEVPIPTPAPTAPPASTTEGLAWPPRAPAQRQRTYISSTYQITSQVQFQVSDPARINKDTKVFDIESLYHYLSDKRPTYVKLIQSEKASSDPSVVHQAAEEMLAKFQHLQPGPVPQSTALCLTLAAIDNCGHADISSHMNDAVCAGVEAGTTKAARDLLLEVQQTGAIPFDLIHDKSIQQTNGFERLLDEIHQGESPYLRAIYDLAIEYITHDRRVHSTHQDTVRKLQDPATLRDKPAHTAVKTFLKLYQSACDTAMLPLGEELWDKQTKLQYLIQSRDDAVRDAFFEDYKRRDVLWLSQTWTQLISHLIKIEHRHALPTGIGTPTTPTLQPGTPTKNHCKLHGDNATHTTDECKAYATLREQLDDATIVRLKPDRICIGHLLGKCNHPNCTFQHKTSAEIAAALKKRQQSGGPTHVLPALDEPPPEPPRPTAPCIPDEPDVDIELICLPDEDNPATRLRLGDDAEYSSDSD